MVRQFSHLPAVPRAIAESVSAAVAAAQEHDATALDAALGALATLDGERVGVVLGGTVRELLEYTHPDGLDSDDVQAVVDRCVQDAAGWLPSFDGDVVVALVAGALGVHGEETVSETARHAAVLLADLVGQAGRSLSGFLTAVFAEIQRAETVEFP
jgi:hypothetical protein